MAGAASEPGRPADGPRDAARGPRLLYLVTEDWYFLSHRLPMARAARDAGYEVVVATRLRDGRAAIEAEGFRAVASPLVRGSLSPVREAAAIAGIARLYRELEPDLVHHVALKPTIYGSVAARLAGVPRVVNAMAGLGYVFVSEDTLARLARPFARALFRRLFNQPGTALLLQNPDDAAVFREAGLISPQRVALVRGSGVDVDRFAAVGPPPAEGPVTAAYVGRMIEDKGIVTLIEAHRLLRGRGAEVRLLLCGIPDPENPRSYDEPTLRAWASEPGIEWRGQVADIAEVWAEAHIAVLPSRREGLPLSLMEAAAAGRPLVATDVPGCREVARAGENALLFPFGDAAALAAALETLAGDPALRARLGERSQAIMRSDMSAKAVGARIVALYEGLLSTGTVPAVLRPTPC